MESLGGDRHGRQAGKKTKMDRHIDRQAGGQPVKHMDRKAGFGTSRLGRLEERQNMDRQTGRRAVSQLDTERGWGQVGHEGWKKDRKLAD